VQKFVSKILNNPNCPRSVKTPNDAIAERDMVVASLILNPETNFKHDFMPHEINVKHHLGMFALALEVEEAQLFMWANNVLKIASSMPLPDHIFSSAEWPHEKMWWTFEDPIGPDPSNLVEEILLVKGVAGINCHCFRQTGDIHKPSITYHIIKNGERILNSETNNKYPILRMAAFLNSPYVKTPHERLDRATRRQLIRAGEPEKAEETVRVVDLRAIQHEAGKTAEGRQIDWSRQWWVRGHIRNQACGPGMKDHKLVWIPPYLKGPEDKPIVEKVYRVVR